MCFGLGPHNPVAVFRRLFSSGSASCNKKMGSLFSTPELSEFQKRKLLHEFTTFFDLNKDGVLEWKDFDMARQKICQLSGWKEGSEKHTKTQEVFIDIWRRLQDEADKNLDGRISAEEWVSMWQKFHKESLAQQKKAKPEAENKLPDWMEQYVEYKFNLYDRTGDGVIDTEEFEYVLSDFGVSSKDARTCYLLFSNNHEKKVDLEYFKALSAEYYCSDDPSALGNFLTGRLDFEQEKTKAKK